MSDAPDDPLERTARLIRLMEKSAEAFENPEAREALERGPIAGMRELYAKEAGDLLQDGLGKMLLYRIAQARPLPPTTSRPSLDALAFGIESADARRDLDRDREPPTRNSGIVDGDEALQRLADLVAAEDPELAEVAKYAVLVERDVPEGFGRYFFGRIADRWFQHTIMTFSRWIESVRFTYTQRQRGAMRKNAPSRPRTIHARLVAAVLDKRPRLREGTFRDLVAALQEQDRWGDFEIENMSISWSGTGWSGSVDIYAGTEGPVEAGWRKLSEAFGYWRQRL